MKSADKNCQPDRIGEEYRMRKLGEKVNTVLIISLLALAAMAGAMSERIQLKNGEAKVEFDLKPGESKQFVISGKQFKNLKISLGTSSKNIYVRIVSPKSKTLASGLGKSFTVKNVGSGDYQINLKNRDKSSVVGSYLVVGEIKG